ncbi:hypothetical protein ALC56_01888 [Trachymyrmex septentrionalis]|uniref:Uncharacterized protein n=1 Tax=Trachymyrmex septentrionalis TaxID=34720 RepID=A0A195FT74_9HYME|nr:hypothetical protein ALC56_01888 [Trachymyrmex septentrionalis]
MCAWTEDPRTFEIIISVDSDRRPFFPQCLVYASSGKLRGSGAVARARGTLFGEANRDLRRRQRKPLRKDTECRKEGERRNKMDREREREREREKGEFSFAVHCNQIRDNARKIPEGSVHHDSSRMIKGDPTRAKRTNCEDEAFNATLSSGFLLPEEDPRISLSIGATALTTLAGRMAAVQVVSLNRDAHLTGNSHGTAGAWGQFNEDDGIRSVREVMNEIATSVFIKEETKIVDNEISIAYEINHVHRYQRMTPRNESIRPITTETAFRGTRRALSLNPINIPYRCDNNLLPCPTF